MKHNKGLLFIVIILICCSFIFGGVEINYKTYKEDSTGYWSKKINSVVFSIEGFEFLELGCDEWSPYPCEVFNATSFQVIFEGYDGMIEENKTLKLIDFNNLEKIFKLLRLENCDDDIVGFVHANAGATGHGSQNFYLINLNTAQWLVISNVDMQAPQWFYEDEKFGYIEEELIYMGWGPNFPLGGRYTKVINSINFFDPLFFDFYKVKNYNNDIYRDELSKIELSDSVLDIFRDRNLHELQYFFRHDDFEGDKYDIEPFIKYVYYHQKLNEHQKLEQEIYSLLDQSFLDCCIYNWNDDNIYRETLINGKNGYKTGIQD